MLHTELVLKTKEKADDKRVTETCKRANDRYLARKREVKDE